MANILAPTTEQLMKLAREQLVEEFVNHRSAAYSKWIDDAESAWKTGGELIPYSSFLRYPSETDIISRAFALNKILNPTVTPAATDLPDSTEATADPVSTDCATQGSTPQPAPDLQSTIAQLQETSSTKQPSSVLAKFKQIASNWREK